MTNGQTSANRAGIWRDSFTSREEAVIFQAAEKRRFPASFPSNRRQRPQWDRMQMENYHDR